MLHEFALEPSLLSSWERFRYFVENFGVPHGRLISRYPKRWKAMVYDSLANCSEIERKRIEQRLTEIDERMMGRAHEWDAVTPWLQNAEAEHLKRPFHAIIAATNPAVSPAVLLADDIDERVERWRVPRERSVARSATDMAQAVRPLLVLARRIIFVDPHFDPMKPKARNALREYLQAALNGRIGISPVQLEMHAKFEVGTPRFLEHCRNELPRRIPRGLQLRVVRWSAKPNGEALHNRYIFTDQGGVRLAWGLDEGAPGETDDISLLDETLYQQRFQLYCGNTPAFDLIEEVTVTGSL